MGLRKLDELRVGLEAPEELGLEVGFRGKSLLFLYDLSRREATLSMRKAWPPAARTSSCGPPQPDAFGLNHKQREGISLGTQ